MSMKKSDYISLAEVALLFANGGSTDKSGYRWTRVVKAKTDDWPRVELEQGKRNWSAYSPDVPGCVSTGKTRAEAQRNFREALEFHLEGLREDGIELKPPKPVKARIGNTLEVLKVIRGFNAENKQPIEVFKARGYDGTPSQVLVISGTDVDRLKIYLMSGKPNARTIRHKSTAFRILDKVDF